VRHTRPAALAFALLCGCGSAPPPKPTPPPEPPPTRVLPPPPLVKQELGDIDEGALKKTFATLDAPLQSCFDAGRRRLPALRGDARVYLRVGEDGHLRYAFYERTSLGDRATERCALDAFAQAAWPAPRGGEAEVRHEFGFDGTGKASATWDGEDGAAALARAPKIRAAIDKCKAGIDGTFYVTMHLTAAKKKLARVLSAGVAAPSRAGEERAECILKALRKLEVSGSARGTPKLELSL
jgi:hypothetical protein